MAEKSTAKTMAKSTTLGGPPTVCPAILYADAKAAITQLKDAFGFTEGGVYEGEDGTVLHAELWHGNGVVMLGSQNFDHPFNKEMEGAGPAAVYVTAAGDVDEHCARAWRSGAEILEEPTDQEYGARAYRARDLEGNIWTFGTYALGE